MTLLQTAAWLAGMSALASGIPAQEPVSSAQLVFHYERPGLPVPVYTLTVRPDGSGSYEASPAATSPANRYAVAAANRPLPTLQALTLNAAEATKLFGWVREAHFFQDGCASRAKGVADTGAKTLTYTSANTTGTCTYNFSEQKSVVALVGFLQAMAFTLDEAQKLQSEHRFDRLALDREMTTLVAAVIDGRATGLANIRPTLASLAEDPQVLERVRTQARKLLEQSTLAR